MQSLEQIRARNSLRCANEDGSKIKGEHGGEVIKKVPPLILNNGLMATSAFAYTQEEGWSKLFDHIARHLADPDVGILPSETTNHKAMTDYLSEHADSQTLKLATAETLAWLGFARRYIGRKSHG